MVEGWYQPSTNDPPMWGTMFNLATISPFWRKVQDRWSKVGTDLRPPIPQCGGQSSIWPKFLLFGGKYRIDGRRLVPTFDHRSPNVGNNLQFGQNSPFWRKVQDRWSKVGTNLRPPSPNVGNNLQFGQNISFSIYPVLCSKKDIFWPN